MAERRKNPSSNLFWNDLRGDEALRRCSLAAKGLWTVHALPCAAESPEHGVVIVGNSPSRIEDLGELFCHEVGQTAEMTQKLFDELVTKGVASVDEKGRLYNRRMVREEADRRSKSAAGKAGAEARWKKGAGCDTDGRPHGRHDGGGHADGDGRTDGRPEGPEPAVSHGKQETIPNAQKPDGWQNGSSADDTPHGKSMHSSFFSLHSSSLHEEEDGENLTEATVVIAPDGAVADATPALTLTGGSARHPEDDAVSIWNEAAQRNGWRVRRKITAEDRRTLRSRLNEVGGIEGWRAAIAECEASDFLSGRKPPGRGHENWRLSFKFLLGKQKLNEVVDGQYRNPSSSSPMASTTRDSPLEARAQALDILDRRGSRP